MHHHTSELHYTPADNASLNRLEHDRDVTYRGSLMFAKWLVITISCLLFLMAVFLI
jgi:hypothetical protein